MSELAPLLALMQVSDSAFPVGAYSHSWGLETAVQSGVLTAAWQVQESLRALLVMSVAPLEGRACALAWLSMRDNDLTAFSKLNNYLSAGRWPSEVHQASLQMGDRLRRLAQAVGWIDGTDDGTAPCSPVHHAPMFGWLSAQLGAEQEAAAAAYLQTAAAAMVSACVRLVPLGHTDGQRILSGLRELIPSLVQTCCVGTAENLSGFAPLHEAACVAHEHLYSRLFQS